MTRGYPTHYLLPDGVHFACQVPWPAEYVREHEGVTCEHCKAAIVEQALGDPCRRHGRELCSCRPCGVCGKKGCSPVEHRGFDPDFNGA